MPANCIISLGSNQGNRIKNLSKTRKLLGTVLGEIKLLSSVYESEPWGYNDPVSYYNQVILIDTKAKPFAVLEKCLSIERALGRIRKKVNYEARPIDLDILFYNNQRINSTYLTIPHPKLHLRKFVLEPLNQIMPDFIHPVLGKSVKELLFMCKDSCWVRQLDSFE